MKTSGEIMGAIGKTYAQKLQDPRWLAFAAGIRRDRGNVCRVCKQTGKVIQVHHVFYYPDREPWEYEGEEIVLLCRECHKAIHVELQKFRKYVFGRLTPRALQVLNGALAVGLDHHDSLTLTHAIAELVSEPRLVNNFCRAFIEGKKV